MVTFIKTRTKNVLFVAKGMFLLIKTEDAIKAQLMIFSAFTVLGFYVNLSANEWRWQLLCFALVLTAESLNTAVEKLSDFIHPDFHKKIGFIKDISAGAVGFAALFALIIGGFIYSKYI